MCISKGNDLKYSHSIQSLACLNMSEKIQKNVYKKMFPWQHLHNFLYFCTPMFICIKTNFNFKYL